jgi:hypothetical protein
MPDFAPGVCLCSPVRELEALTEKSGATGDKKWLDGKANGEQNF